MGLASSTYIIYYLITVLKLQVFHYFLYMSEKVSLIISLLFLSLFADDIDSGISLFSRGEYNEACEYINKAYREKPTSPKAQLAYAKTVSDGMEAEKLYKRITENQSAADSLKSEACFQRGLFYYCKEEYERAMRMFSKAQKLSAGTRNKHMKALAACNKGDNHSAEPVWFSMTSGKNKKRRGRALYYLGNMFYRQGKYEQAYNFFKSASEMDGEAWVVPSYAGACLSSYYAGDTLFSTILYSKIKNKYPSLLEEEQLKRTFTGSCGFVETDSDLHEHIAASANTIFEKGDAVSKASEKAAYTLQVGAFSSEENAKCLFRKMKKKFENVSIKKEKLKESFLHKVRVELFTDKEEARAYGEKHLKSRGLTFRVVEK